MRSSRRTMAQLARTTAAIAQARSAISQAEARLEEAKAAFERAKPLKAAGHMSESVFDQRQQAARTAEALLVSARDGLRRWPRPRRPQIEAQRRELTWRRGRTEVRGARRRHRQPPQRARRRMAPPAPPSRCSASSPTARWSSTPRSPRPTGPHRRGPARARRGRRRRRDRRQGAPRLARGRQGDAPGPRAHLPRRQPRAAGRRVRARRHRDRSSHGLAVPLSAVMYGARGATSWRSSRTRWRAAGPPRAGRRRARCARSSPVRTFLRDGDAAAAARQSH